jgi:hypothetical protein
MGFSLKFSVLATRSNTLQDLSDSRGGRIVQLYNRRFDDVFATVFDLNNPSGPPALDRALIRQGHPRSIPNLNRDSDGYCQIRWEAADQQGNFVDGGEADSRNGDNVDIN